MPAAGAPALAETLLGRVWAVPGGGVTGRCDLPFLYFEICSRYTRSVSVLKDLVA
jgi:hypothetical protein